MLLAYRRTDGWNGCNRVFAGLWLRLKTNWEALFVQVRKNLPPSHMYEGASIHTSFHCLLSAFKLVYFSRTVAFRQERHAPPHPFVQHYSWSSFTKCKLPVSQHTLPHLSGWQCSTLSPQDFKLIPCTTNV